MAVGEVARLLGFLIGTLLFIAFMAMDVRKAFRRGIYWVPGHALVLSALTIQIMNFVEVQSSQAVVGSKTLEEEVGENNFIMIHSTRVMICVLIAFFLPGMARASYENKWTKIAALGLAVFVDIFSELSTLYSHFAASRKGVSLPAKGGLSWVSFMISDVLISISLMWLILLLICATRASKSIRKIANQRVPFILDVEAQDVEADPANYWQAIENHVLKSWIVVYVCSPQAIIAQSVLTSSASLVVTICIVSSIVGWVVRGPKIAIPADTESFLKLIITIMEVIFVLIGWVVIGWRSLSSLRYYKRGKGTSWSDWFKQFLVEDFWTWHIKDKEKSKYHKNIEASWTKHVEDKEYEWKLREGENIVHLIIPKGVRRVLLRCVLLLQVIVVFFSKVSCFLIEVTFYNGVIREIMSVLLKDAIEKEFESYGGIFKKVEVVGQDAKSAFATNRKAIKHAQKLFQDGCKLEGKDDCKRLITFLKRKTSCRQPLTDLTKMSPPLCVGARGSFVPAEPYSRLKFDCNTCPQLEEEKYLKYMSEKSWSWKLTTVSLINIIFSLCPKCGRECVEAYNEAWQLMDMVDKWDPDTDSFLRKAADGEFDKLMDRGPQNTHECCPTTISVDWMVEAITELAVKKKIEVEAESKKESKGTLSSPVDWQKLAAAIALYKLCKAIISQNARDVLPELKNEIKMLIKATMAACIYNVGTALEQNCRKWAQDLEEEREEKLLNAIYVAGKYKGLMEALGWKVGEVYQDVEVCTEVGYSYLLKRSVGGGWNYEL